MQAVLDDLQISRPAVHARLRVHETGAAVPALDEITAVVFWLADPLREHFPECFQEASAIATEARSRGIPIANPPDALSNTVKSMQARLWNEAGIPTPEQLRFESRDDLLGLLDQVRYPVIVRSDDEHAQRGMRLCASPAAVESAVDPGFRFPGALSPIVDARTDYRASAEGTVWGRYHHKKRALVLGQRVVPLELFFSRSPIVASETCTFHRYAGRRRLPDALASLLPWERRCIEADRAYAAEGPVPEDLLRHAIAALGLDLAAVDYADLVDGSSVLWEANPHFRLPRVESMYLAGPRGIRQRHEAVHAAIGDWLDELEGRELWRRSESEVVPGTPER